jgi:putative transposase
LIYSQNIEIILSKENQLILDGQSKILNWLYNHLLDLSIKQYDQVKIGTLDKTLLNKKYGLRNYMVNEMKESPDYKFINSVYSKPLKESAMRLENSFKKLFKEKTGYPKFRSWKKNWFSLFYDEANVGYKIENDKLTISCGKDLEGKRIKIEAILKNKLKSDKLKTLRVCKKLNKYYINLTFEKVEPVKKETKSWISIDQNHKNFFCAVDHNANKIIFNKNNFIKYTEKQIDEVKSLLDKKKKFLTKNDKNYNPNYKQYTKKYDKLKRKLNKLYDKIREQKKNYCNSVANYLFKNYDLVIIGDYTPDINTAKYDTMHRSMLNQEMIGQFRRVLQHQAAKSGKSLKINSERHTTSDCCFCGDRVYKDPSIREFACPKCGHKFQRDLNSSVNIGKEEIKMLSGTDFLNSLDLSEFNYSLSCSFSGVSKHELNREHGSSLAKITQ